MHRFLIVECKWHILFSDHDFDQALTTILVTCQYRANVTIITFKRSTDHI